MRFSVLFLFILVLTDPLLAQQEGNSEKLASEKKGKFPIPSGAVRYAVSGDASGFSELYFDRNGWRSAYIEEIIFERYGISNSKKTKKLVDGDFVYRINLSSGSGEVSSDKNWSSLLAYKNSPEVLEAILGNEGGKLSTTDTILNKKCRVWVFEDNVRTKLWEHHGIPLKMVKKIPGYSYTIEATSIDLEAQPDEEVFSLPDSITWN